jgi:hypothetical protein
MKIKLFPLIMALMVIMSGFSALAQEESHQF